jgi:hypothetical protein
MTRDDLIRIAKNEYGIYAFTAKTLEHFIDLVAAAERERMITEGYRQCAEGQSTTQYCGLLEAAVKAERTRCIDIAEEWDAPIVAFEIKKLGTKED